jgi:RNA ligase (TIGR02306 family)
MERKLASIRRIAEIKPIEGADAIEAVRVDGWWVVVKKSEFNAGDLVCYFEIDGFIPSTIAPFLTKPGKEPKMYEGVQGERLRTVRLRGQLSQGLILPYTILDSLPTKDQYRIHDEGEGSDVTELLGILKYEPPIPAELAGLMKGTFPSFIKKTDQERIQNLPEWFEFRDILWEVSIKLDGSSMTVYHNNGDTGVCSRRIDLKEDETNSFWKMAHKYNMIPALIRLGRNIALQGELVGEGIQGNHEKLSGQDFFLFDIWDIDLQRHCTPMERLDLLDDLRAIGCDLKEVPMLFDAVPIFLICPTMEDMLRYAGDGPSLNAEIREGLVFKATQPINDEILSFKAINNAYLELKK